MRQEQPEARALWATLTVFGFYSVCNGKPLGRFTVEQGDHGTLEKTVLAAEKKRDYRKSRAEAERPTSLWTGRREWRSPC